ncbi:MAG: phosphatidate cytidylyltransferase [Ferruginibacter sp.]|nr:phosphatidate cytidylyltransferase [Cytophagales bacterium]
MRSNFSQFSNLQQRVLTALVALSILIPALRYSEWAYFVVFFAISMLTMLEFYRLVGLDDNQPLKFYGTFVGLFIYTLTFLIEHGFTDDRYYFLISPVASCIFFIKLYKKNERKPFTNIAFTFLGLIYVAVPIALLHVFILRNGVYSYQILLGCLFLLWASDTGAYFAGVRYGKTKLFERVSPKKSWEGSVGGALAAGLTALVLGFSFGDLPAWQWYGVAVIIVVAGTYGDLVESLFKRSIAIKDSGNSLPGHGGFLDRFDGLLLSAPFIATFLSIV